MAFFSWLIGQGAVMIMPIFMLLLCLIFRANAKQSLSGAVKIAVGFTALNGLLGIIFGGMEPAVASMVERFDVGFSVLDIGWPTQTAMGWAIPWGMLAAVLFFLLNLVLLLLGRTKTLNADFNNIWIINTYIFFIKMVTGNWILAIGSGVLFWLICIKIADWFAPCISAYYGMDGIDVTHYYSIAWAPIGFLLDKIWDKVPGINKINWQADEIQKKFGFFGEPIFMGFVIGLLVGCIAYVKLPLSLDAVGAALSLGFTVAFFMYIVPRCAELVIAGMGPLSDAIREFVSKKLPGKEYYIGLDVAVLVGAPEHSAIGVLTTPVAFLLAFLLPGNKVLPMGDVAGLFIFICVFLCNTNKGNIFRGLLNSALFLIPASFYIGGAMAPVNMEMLSAINYALPEGSGVVTSLCLGTVPLLYAFYEISIFIAGIGTIKDLLIGLAITAAFLVPWYIMRNRPAEYVKELNEERMKS